MGARSSVRPHRHIYFCRAEFCLLFPSVGKTLRGLYTDTLPASCISRAGIVLVDTTSITLHLCVCLNFAYDILCPCRRTSEFLSEFLLILHVLF